jgi:hypothetical protein
MAVKPFPRPRYPWKVKMRPMTKREQKPDAMLRDHLHDAEPPKLRPANDRRKPKPPVKPKPKRRA